MVFDPWNSIHQGAQNSKRFPKFSKDELVQFYDLPMGSFIKGFESLYIDYIDVNYMIITQLIYESMKVMNPSFWLLYGLLDVDFMLMNSSVDFYGQWMM